MPLAFFALNFLEAALNNCFRKAAVVNGFS